MKRFDEESVKARLIERMKTKSEFATILDDGALSNLFDVVASGFAELGRYNEYSFLETKWETAQNISSLTAMAQLIGRKRNRPKSAIGYIIVSHTDANGGRRLENLGNTFFDINEASDYDDITRKEDANYIERSSLVPWTHSKSYTIPKGTIFMSNSGVQFISTRTVRTKSLVSPYSVIKNNESEYNSFLKNGGWNGIKYLKVPVIQGIEREATLGTTDGSRFQSFRIDATDIENASNSTSKNYFYVTVTTPSGDTQKYYEISNIRIAHQYDTVFEANILKDGSGVMIKFGDGFSGAIPPANSTVKLHYLETLGAKGNISTKYQIQSYMFPNGTPYMLDPRVGRETGFISCTNNIAITGGHDIENEDEFKVKAPASYLNSYAIATIDAYTKTIMENSSIALSKLKCFTKNNYTVSSVTGSTVEDELNMASSNLFMTALKSNNTPLDEAESEDFLNEVRLLLNDVKGPNDSFKYVAPNMIDIEPSIKIMTDDSSINEHDAIQNIKNAVFSEYSLYNSDFGKNLYASRISYLAQLYPFVKSVDIKLDSKATVNISDNMSKVVNTITVGGTNKTYAMIPFKFDTLFALGSANKGFKNFRDNEKYTIKIDIINNYDSSKSRTLFLLDNRLKSSTEDVPITVAKLKDLEDSEIISSSMVGTGNSGNFQLALFKEVQFSGLNIGRQCRVAQFPLIDGITTSASVDAMLKLTSSPREIRPLVTDTSGNYKVYSVDDVEQSLRCKKDATNSINESPSVGDTDCWKIDTSYIDGIDIAYNENYEFYNSDDYASGCLFLPTNYFDTSDPALIYTIVKNYLTVNVYAQPRKTDLEPDDWNDLIYVKDMNIEIVKNIN